MIKVSWYSGKGMIKRNLPRDTFMVDTDSQAEALTKVRAEVGSDGILVAQTVKEEKKATFQVAVLLREDRKSWANQDYIKRVRRKMMKVAPETTFQLSEVAYDGNYNTRLVYIWDGFTSLDKLKRCVPLIFANFAEVKSLTPVGIYSEPNKPLRDVEFETIYR